MASVIQKTVQNGKIKANDVELYYEVQGEGDPIIFIHGIGGNLIMWKYQAEFFSNKYKVIAYDVRGHGKSDKPNDGYTFQSFSNDLYAFMRGLKIDKAIIIGHSMGGGIAITFALEHPEMVSKLALLSTEVKGGGNMAYYQMWLLMHIFPYKSLLKTLATSQASDNNNNKEMEIETAVKMFMGTPKSVFLKCFKDISKYDVTAKVSSIKIPALIIVGEKDTMAPAEKSRFLNREISGSKLVVIPNAKHAINLQNPQEVNKAIEEFINKS